MKKNMVLFALLLTMLMACSQPENTLQPNEERETQPIHYETEEEQKERKGVRDQTIGEQGGYIQSEQPHLKYVDRDQDYTDPYKNEEALLLTEELNKLDYLATVEVSSAEDRIVIGVMLQANDSHKPISDEAFAEQIEAEVKKILPDTDKDIIVFSQESEWGELKNLDGRIQD